MNNYCVPQVSEVSHTEGNYSYANMLCQKNNSVYFLAICANFSCKAGKFESKVVSLHILETGHIL